MDERVFLDANVLFSAAYSTGGRCSWLWDVEGAVLCTSAYALEEAERNLAVKGKPGSVERLAELAKDLRVVLHMTSALPFDTGLPDKDEPILAAAIEIEATHLITGDSDHFGAYYGRSIGGVVVMRPAEYRAHVVAEGRLPLSH